MLTLTTSTRLDSYGCGQYVWFHKAPSTSEVISQGWIERQSFSHGFRAVVASDVASVQVGFYSSFQRSRIVTRINVGIQINIPPSKTILKNNQQRSTLRRDYGMTESSSPQTREMSLVWGCPSRRNNDWAEGRTLGMEVETGLEFSGCESYPVSSSRPRITADDQPTRGV